LAPTSYRETVTNLNFAQIGALNTGSVPSLATIQGLSPNAPGQSYPFGTNVPYDGTRNASLDIQHQLGKGTVIDIGYAFDYSFNQPISYNLNYLPVGTGWPFTPSNLSPVTAGSNSNDIGSNFERTVFPGLGSVTGWCWCGHTNYNGLNVTATKRVSNGLAFGLNYSFSKSMGLLSDTAGATGVNGVPTNEQWNYGRQSSDRTHNLTLTYNYDVPGLAKKLGIKGLGLITDHWALSGITAIHSGAPYNPGCSLVSGSPSITGGGNAYTGTGDITDRCNVIGNPYTGMGTNGNGPVYFNPSAFAMATINTTGPNNSVVGGPVLSNLGGGSGDLSLPRVTNFDLTLAKTIPLGSEKRTLKIQAQGYNIFNHTEISGINTGITFNSTTNAVTNTPALGYINGASNARILAFTARFQF
jgi:hypothetical protein